MIVFILSSCGIEVVTDNNVRYEVEVTFKDNTKDTVQFYSSSDPSLDTDTFNNSCCLETFDEDIACNVKSYQILSRGSVQKGVIEWHIVILFIFGVIVLFQFLK